LYLKLLIIQFFNDLLQQKLRAFLTLFGLTWGTTAIMLMLAIGEANKNQMLKQMQAFGQNVVSFWPGWASKSFKGLNKYRRIKFTLDDVNLIRKFPCVSKAGGKVNAGNREVKYLNKEIAFSVCGVEPDWTDLRNIQADNGGRGINKSDVIRKRRVALIGNKVKDELFGKKKPIGKYIYVLNSPFLVVGVLRPKYEASFFKEMNEDTVFLPISTFMSMFNRNYIDNIAYRPSNLKKNKQTLTSLIHFFARIKSFDPDDKTAIGVWDMTDSDKFIGDFSLGLQIFMGVVGIFTMTVAAIGVANIMNVIVEERTKEIGVKMALGIKRYIIMLQFVFESFMFTLVGGIFGLLISKLVCTGLRIMEVKGMGKPEVTVYVAVITTVVLGIAALLAGFFPARRASKLDPVEALRWQ